MGKGTGQQGQGPGAQDKLRLPGAALSPRADGDMDLTLTSETLQLLVGLLGGALGGAGHGGAGPLPPPGDIDAWNSRQRGDWQVFTARLDPGLGPRDYRRPLSGGDIIADAPGPLWAHLGFGGPRLAGFVPGPARMAYHVLAPGDHIHSVGLEGTAEAHPTAALQRIPHRSLAALIADQLLLWRADQGRALPLALVRVETDPKPGPDSPGFANFACSLASLVAAAKALGTHARLSSLLIEVPPGASAEAMASATRDLMARIEALLARQRLPRAPFLLFADAASPDLAAAHWQLAVFHRPFRLLIPAPLYALEINEFRRPTEAALLRMGEYAAHALTCPGWHLPIPLLAEVRKKRLAVTFQTRGPLVLDQGLGAGPAHGFVIEGASKRVQIEAAEVSAQDPGVIILTLDRQIEGPARLGYGLAGPGGVRDDWAAPSGDGGALHRWALPASLAIHPADGHLT